MDDYLEKCDKLRVRLIESVPELQFMFDSHLNDYDELLPHVFFGDLARYVKMCYQAPYFLTESQSLRNNGIRILGILEEALVSPSPEIQELIAVSFLEHFSESNDKDLPIIKDFGSNLQILFKQQSS